MAPLKKKSSSHNHVPGLVAQFDTRVAADLIVPILRQEELDEQDERAILFEDPPSIKTEKTDPVVLPGVRATAGFRRKPRANYMKRRHTAKLYYRTADYKSRDSYFHYEEPTAEELNERVEYDMDLEDFIWLKNFNQTIGVKNQKFNLSEDDFERVMDRLEKESYFDRCRTPHRDGEADEDAECAICGDGQSIDLNAIVFCDMCDLAVHQECYGVPYVPLGSWLCKRCQFSPAQNVECCLCPNLGGAFKQTDTSNFNPTDKKMAKVRARMKGWAHVVCALWVPEATFANTVFLEPIESIENIEPARWSLKCYICNKKHAGACIQCNKPNCFASFHVTCAKQAKLHMKIKPQVYRDANGDLVNDVKREVFCDKHAPVSTSEAGGGGGGGAPRASNAMYSGDDSDEDFESPQYRKKEMGRQKNLKKARDTLAKQAKEFKKDAAIVKVDQETLVRISKEITHRGKKTTMPCRALDRIRFEYAERIQGYWYEKRKARNGVPLLRRLQVSLNTRYDMKLDKDKDKERYTNLRYDLEKSRILMGEILRRERCKMKGIKVAMQILNTKLDIFDEDCPAQCD